MPRIKVKFNPDVLKTLFATHRKTIDGVTLKERVKSYTRYLLKHFDDQHVYIEANEFKLGLRRIVYDRLDGLYYIKQEPVRKWWKL